MSSAPHSASAAQPPDGGITRRKDQRGKRGRAPKAAGPPNRSLVSNLLAGDRLDPKVHHPQVLVVDLPEEIEETGIAVAHARGRVEQLAGHVVPTRLAVA